jgi:GNAT superfamily N-acetyltransferase
MPVERFSPDHALWPDYVRHLKRHNMARWVLGDDDQSLPDIIFLGTVENQDVIGHVTLKEQVIQVPVEDATVPLLDGDGNPVRETFVYTFAVDEDFRRQGHGRALQVAAIATTKALGCYQMRSWCSLDKPANYALKLSLGFAVHPAVQTTEHGRRIGGVYFVKTV